MPDFKPSSQDKKVNAEAQWKTLDDKTALKLAALEQEVSNMQPAHSEMFPKISHMPDGNKPVPVSSIGNGTTINAWTFWFLVIVSLFLAQMPVIGWLFTPVTQFTTMIHELGHALVCLATGGHVSGLTIVADGQGHGGITNCFGGMPFFYTQAGYLGTAIFGCLLIYLGQYAKLSRPILFALGFAIGMAAFILVGANVFATGFAGIASFLWGLALSAGLIWAALKLKPATANLLLLFLAIQTALNSVTCILALVQYYFGFQSIGGAFTDASNMSDMTHIPALIWSLFWFLSSLAMLGLTLWHTYGKRIFRSTLKV